MKNLDTEKKFIELRSAGYSLRDIAKMLAKSTTTLVKWNKKYFTEVETVRRKELEELQLILLDEKKSRLDFLRKELKKIKKKIDSNEIILRYEDLITLAIKVSDAIDKCQKQIVFSNTSENEIEIPVSENADFEMESQQENETNTKL